MTRLIDADALSEQYTEMVERLLLIRGSIVPGHVTTLIVNAPTIDAVEVVRCKDCKHRYVSGVFTTHYYVCDFLDAENKDDGFCSYGERGEP